MRRLGQHFLRNGKAVKKIVEALELEKGDVVIEIGPGHGELTGELLASGFELSGKNRTTGVKIIAIEKDKDLTIELRKRVANDKNIEVIEGDVLKLLPSLPERYRLKDKRWKLVGNIPYYITGHLLRKISELEQKPDLCILMVQKEVADRIAAKPPDMNRLAASVQFWAKPEILIRLAKNDFDPPPEVESAIIMLKSVDRKLLKNSDSYYKAVRTLFAQPRKTILNNLSAVLKEKGKISEILSGKGIPPENRPQDLSVEQIEEIASSF